MRAAPVQFFPINWLLAQSRRLTSWDGKTSLYPPNRQDIGAAPKAVMAVRNRRQATGGIATPAEVADAVLWPDARGIGHVLPIDADVWP